MAHKRSLNRYFFCLLAVTVLTGCGTKPRNIPMSENFWQDKQQKIVIASFKAPTPEVHQVGSQGLLDYGINKAANRGLNTHLKNTDLSWYRQLPTDFIHQLKSHHFEAALYSEHPVADQKKSLESLLAHARTENAKLLTLKLQFIGGKREYYSIIPKGAPEAYCVLVGELIDPNDKKVWWHHETEVIQPIKGAWDQSPGYPNFSQALQEAVDVAREELIDSFFCGH